MAPEVRLEQVTAGEILGYICNIGNEQQKKSEVRAFVVENVGDICKVVDRYAKKRSVIEQVQFFNKTTQISAKEMHVTARPSMSCGENYTPFTYKEIDNVRSLHRSAP